MTSDLTNQELKPCPFCGNPPYSKRWMERAKMAIRIWCDECSVSPKVQGTATNAIEAWNYRYEE